MGRPTLYTKALGVTICERIASGESVRNIALDDGMPQKSTIIAWSLNPEHDFYGQYEKARESRVEVMADELVDIADDGGDEGVQRSRLPSGCSVPDLDSWAGYVTEKQPDSSHNRFIKPRPARGFLCLVVR